LTLRLSHPNVRWGPTTAWLGRRICAGARSIPPLILCRRNRAPAWSP